jgi:hypothetical protein
MNAMKGLGLIQGARPLWMEGVRVYAQCCNRIVALDLDSGERTHECDLPGSLLARLVRTQPLLSRLFRLNCLWVERLDQDGLLFATRDGVFRVGAGRAPTLDLRLGQGVYFLSVAQTDGFGLFDSGLYAGEYLSNAAMKPVAVWHRDGEGSWRIVYTFPQGSINHVHAVVPDPANRTIWILTGDFGQAPGIWRSTPGFERIERVFGPDQRSRACWLLAQTGRLAWASDTQLEVNAVYAADPEHATEPSKLCAIPGSSIYATAIEDGMLFSTVVEPARASRHNPLAWFAARPAKSINAVVEVAWLSADHRIKPLFRFRPRRLPFRLFEYPTVLFPRVHGSGPYFCMYGRTLQGCDDTLMFGSMGLLRDSVMTGSDHVGGASK